MLEKIKKENEELHIKLKKIEEEIQNFDQTNRMMSDKMRENEEALHRFNFEKEKLLSDISLLTKK